MKSAARISWQSSVLRRLRARRRRRYDHSHRRSACTWPRLSPVPTTTPSPFTVRHACCPFQALQPALPPPERHGLLAWASRIVVLLVQGHGSNQAASLHVPPKQLACV